MTLDDFTDLIDACGGDPARWPPGAAAGAERLLATSAEARRVLGAMQAAEQALADTRLDLAPPGLAEAALRGRQETLPRLPAWTGAAGWAAAAAVALSLGLAAGSARGPFEDPGHAVAWALTPSPGEAPGESPGEAPDAG